MFGAAYQLLVTLTGVTFLFGLLQDNGTIERAVGKVLRAGRRPWLLPPTFFLMAAATCAVGPGGILSTALIAPFAMTAGLRAGLSPFVIALMVCHGSMAGFLSPFSTTGAVAAGLLQNAGLGGYEFRIWMISATVQTAIAAVAFALFGRAGSREVVPQATDAVDRAPFTRAQIVSALVIAVWIAGAVAFRWPLGWSAFAAAAVLVVARVASPIGAVRRMPWKIIALVVSISTLVGVAERSGTLEWFKDALTWMATADSVYAVVAFIGGVISAYSSTTAVVLPAFLPLAPAIAERFVGVDTLALATSIMLGSTLVDVSPLSTIGALAVSVAPKDDRSRTLFRRLLLWGFAMTFVAAAICHVGAPYFAAR
jgi:di/tricarboxylate transporter